MKECRREGELRAFLDAELPAAEAAAVQQHLEVCPVCKERLTRLQQNRDWAQERLDVLSRPELEHPLHLADAHRRVVQPDKIQFHWKERFAEMMNKRNKWRPLWVAVAVVAILGIALTIEPVRVLAEDFLSIFRVQEIAIMPLGPEQVEKLEEISMVLEQNFLQVEPVLEQQPELVAVASLEDAEAAAGYHVQTPSVLPEGYDVEPTIEVSGAAAGELPIDLELARSAFEMMGLDPMLLPDSLGEQPVYIEIQPLVTQTWRRGNRSTLAFLQGPSPVVDYPDDVDPEVLGEAVFQLLGINEREAQRLSRSIDWTSTLVVPVPADLASFREVTINGNSGLLFLGQENASGGTNSAVLWQENGQLFFLAGNVNSTYMMETAESVR